MNRLHEVPPVESARLQLLGTPTLWFADRSHRFLSFNDAALFALLALRGPLARDWLAPLIWPDSTMGDARNSLRQRRAKLYGATGLKLLGGDKLQLALDASVLHDLGNPVPALKADPTALCGDLLGSFAMSGVEQRALKDELELERQRWQDRMLAALLEVGNFHEAAGRVDPAMVCARRLLGGDSMCEPGVRLAMRLHHRLGDHASALELFERFKKALHEEYGDPPSDETIQLANAIGQNRVPGVKPVAAVPLALQHPRHTVGRDAVIAEAEYCCRSRGVVVLTGGPGIGKTRVFDDLVHRWNVSVVVRLQPGDEKFDLALVGRLSAAMLPLMADNTDGELVSVLDWWARQQLAPRPDGPMHMERMGLLLRRALSAALRAGMTKIAIDDLHYADNESLSLLCSELDGAAARADDSSRRTPRWLLTSRDSPMPAPLSDWLNATDDAGQVQIGLEPLTASDLIDMLNDVEVPNPSRWATALNERCGGHPLSVLQVLRELNQRGALRSPVPPSELPIPQEVMRRTARAFDRSHERAQQLAFIVALAGSDFSSALATRLMGCSATEFAVWWRQLQSLGVMSKRALAFSHDLMRQAVQEAVPADVARAIHGEIAQALSAMEGAPASLAQHWEAAGDFAKAAAACNQAAGVSLAAGLHARARQRWLHAAMLYERIGLDDAAFDVRWEAGTQTRSSVSALEATEQAADLLTRARNPQQRARALCLLAETRAEQLDVGAINSAREALALARDLGDAQLMASARLFQALSLHVAGEWPLALSQLDELTPDLHLLFPKDRAAAQTLRASVLAGCGRRSEAVGLTLQMLAAAQAGGDRIWAAEVANNASIRLASLSRVTMALDMALRGRALSMEAGYEASHLLVDDLNIAAFYADLGRFGDAIEYAERAATGMRAAGSWGWMLSAENVLASVFCTLGKPDLARRLLADPPPAAPMFARAMRLAAQARWQRTQGRSPLRGLQRAAEMMRAGGALGSPDVRQRVDLELATWSGPALAAQQAAEARSWARAHEHVSLWRRATLVAIGAALQLGDPAAAARNADELDGDMGLDGEFENGYLPELWCAQCSAWDAVGRYGRAQEVAERGVAWVDARMSKDVPEDFRRSFIDNNKFNQALRDRAVTQR